MRQTMLIHPRHVSRRARIMAVTLVASFGILGATLPAGALANEFPSFAQCPLTNGEVVGCIFAKTESGKVTLGNKTVPIEKTITLQGGFTENRETGEQHFVGAANGETLSKTPQTVPGGLLGVVAPELLPKFLRELINKLVSEGLAGVTATTELATPASSIELNEKNLLFEEGTALGLPVKIKLNNPTFLGEECYVGSNLHPIELKLTTGTTSPPKPNEPISGKVGKVFSTEGGLILNITENSLVDNSFSAPKASGCGGLLAFLIDPAVDAELGVTTEGHNAAVLEGTLKQASAEVVKARL